ncbi:membrane-spanning 4-domains subfamily A member 4A-like [Hoplias malabaricus]|uniref:membrane-spanning 4-domains subfamily A member 4A-like n=1 Tax=Hoplias malabaricus TaxID=27720 RepID=UPI0034637390
MTDENEVEILDSSNHCTEAENHNSQNVRALVEVTFKKNPYQEHKYLEAEPKALGLTQIILSCFFLSVNLVIMHHSTYFSKANVVLCSFSVVGLVAGSVAIAAQNLHSPKPIWACLGMQIVLCAITGFGMLLVWTSAGSHMLTGIHACWNFPNESDSLHEEICETVQNAYEHVQGVQLLLHAAQIAISATLAAFCCKVVQCCSPRTSVPMIVVNTPSAPQ